MADIKVNIKLNKTETNTQDSLSLDKSWIKNVESISETTSQPNGLFYGVLPNSGNIDVLDLDGTISQYIDDGILPNSNVPADITANGKQVQKHIINDSTYDINSRTLSVQLTNQLSAWDELQYGGYAYPNESKTAYEMLSHCLLSVGYSEDEISLMLSEIIVYGTLNIRSTVADYLKAITIPYPYLPADTLRNTVDKFCRLAQLQVFVNDNGEIKFVSARPVASVEDKNKSLVLRAKNQKARFEETKILKNKYNAVEISEKKVDDIVDYNRVIGSYSDSNLFDKFTNINNAQDDGEKVVTYTSGGGSSELQYNTSAYYGYVEDYYTSGTVVINKKSKLNLEQILNFYTGKNSDGENNIRVTVTCKKETGIATRLYSPTGGGWQDLKLNIESSEEYSGVIEQAKTILHEVSSNPEEVSVPDKTNLGTLNYVLDESGNYIINYVVLIGKKTINVGGEEFQWASQGRYYPDVNATGFVEIYTPQQLEITFYGDKRTITFEDMSASDANITTTEYVSRVDGSELLQEGTTFNQNQLVDDSYQNVATKMSEIIKNNIKNDYANGIADGKVPVICSDYYNINGELVKDWSIGQIIEPADCVRVDKDNNGNSVSKYKDGSDKFWRVVGRTFSKQGVPKNALSVQEVKFVETVEPIKITYQLTFPDRLVVYSDDKRIYSGDRVEEGQSVVIKSVDKGNYGSITVNYIQANGVNVSLNQEIMIKENTTFTVSFDAKKVVNEQFYFDTSYGDVQEIVYNPDDYENAIGFVNIMLADYGSGTTVNVPTNGYREITLRGYTFSVDVDNISVFIKSHNTLHGMRGEIGTSLKLGTIVE